MKFVIIVPLIFSNCEITCVLTEFPASIYDIKTAVRPYPRHSMMSQSCAIASERREKPKFGQVGTQGLTPIFLASKVGSKRNLI